MIATPEMFVRASRAVAVRSEAEMAAEMDALPVPARERIPAAALVALINRQIAVRPGCDGIIVSADGLRPGMRDRSGCNWNPSVLRVGVEHGASTRALAAVRQVVEWARVRYDVT